MLRFLSLTSCAGRSASLAVIAGFLCFPPSPAASAACGLAELIRDGATVDDVRHWFEWGGSKAAINQSCGQEWLRPDLTPLEQAVLRLDLGLLKLLFTEGGDAAAIGDHVFGRSAFWASRRGVDRFGWPTD